MNQAAPTRKALTPARAWLCAGINQLAFPGLGTVLAGRRIGYAQATLMVIGFALVMVFMGAYFLAVFRILNSPGFEGEQYATSWRSWLWAGQWGSALSVLAWCWSLASSVSLVRQATHPPPVPAHPEEA
jgi:hypothetical protein